jgi:predicted nucleotidyltransferase component of viral defense system
MLQYQTIYPETLELLKKLMRFSQLDDFFLVGGSALALHLGHRISVDLDLFTQKDINTSDLLFFLNEKFELKNTTTDKNTVTGFINFHKINIKVEFISYKYKLLKPIIGADEIRLFELDDLIPMKLSAIAGRGAKKDFYDIFFLLEKYDLKEMLDLYKRKYATENLFHLLKSLTFFDDAENDPEPILLKKVNWKKVKQRVVDEVKKIVKNIKTS